MSEGFEGPFKEMQDFRGVFKAGLTEPLRLGCLSMHRAAGRETFEFEFERSVLSQPVLANLNLDPRLGLFEGRQYPAQGSETFAAFADASPERWGRLLMQRRLKCEQRAGLTDPKIKLYESDYLLGMHDIYRAGALRFRCNEMGAFLDNQHDFAAPPFVQLRELWSRIVFNLLVSNTDDHSRNHDFLLVPGKGWRLSEAFDMNPVSNANGLKLNISEADNAMDLGLARSVAPYFRLSTIEADEIIDRQQAIVRQWPKIATSLKISIREQKCLSDAFQLAS